MLFIVALLATNGCTRAVDVPRAQFEAASRDGSVTHRIRLKKNAEYMVRQFSVTDSTIVVTQLSPSDANYRLARLPIVIPLDEVDSIARAEPRKWVPFVVVGAGIALAVTVVAIAASFAGSE